MSAESELLTLAVQTNVKSLKVISTNLQSVVSEVINKHNLDIIFGSETSLTASISSSEIFLLMCFERTE